MYEFSLTLNKLHIIFKFINGILLYQIKENLSFDKYEIEVFYTLLISLVFKNEKSRTNLLKDILL